MPHFELYIAGGNMGGDCDAQGAPVVEGMHYLASEGLTVAGPFQSAADAVLWILGTGTLCATCYAKDGATTTTPDGWVFCTEPRRIQLPEGRTDTVTCNGYVRSIPRLHEKGT
jgi:hypothetical protein